MKATLVAAVLLSLSAGVAQAADDVAEERTWIGRWNNRKYGTSGPLKCVAKEKEGKWTATFTGTFQGDPFSYNATFQSKEGRGQKQLAGTAVIRGHQYQWVGVLKGNAFRAQYKSSVGYFGEFVMMETKKKTPRN